MDWSSFSSSSSADSDIEDSILDDDDENLSVVASHRKIGGVAAEKAAQVRDGSFAHGYGYPRVPYPNTMGMGKT